MRDKNIRILIVDDSALVRDILAEGLSGIEGFEVVGTAADAFDAGAKIPALRPDVMTLDVEMPRMNGIEFLRRLMPQYPLPIIMVSALTERGCRLTLDALALGAVDFVTKPKGDQPLALQGMLDELAEKIRAAAGANLARLWRQAEDAVRHQAASAADSSRRFVSAESPKRYNSTDSGRFAVPGAGGVNGASPSASTPQPRALTPAGGTHTARLLGPVPAPGRSVEAREAGHSPDRPVEPRPAGGHGAGRSRTPTEILRAALSSAPPPPRPPAEPAPAPSIRPAPPPVSSHPPPSPARTTAHSGEVARRVVALGASTGGSEALRTIMTALPASTPGVVVVQHMPVGFTRLFAERLDSLCAMRVKEAEDGDMLLNGRALVAPGGRQMRVVKDAATGGWRVSVREREPVNGHVPSVDVLFRSIAENAGANAVGVMLTGMGSDGAEAMRLMRERGARCFAQDQATSVVFGMPAEAYRRGGAERLVPLPDIAAAIVDALTKSGCQVE